MKRSEKVVCIIVVLVIYAILFWVAKQLPAANGGLHFTF